jgi:hypothetical protein
MKRWQVRGGMSYRTADGKTVLPEGAQFEATEDDVAHMRSHIEPVPEPAPELRPEPEPDEVPRRRRGRPPKNRALYTPPQHTAY